MLQAHEVATTLDGVLARTQLAAIALISNTGMVLHARCRDGVAQAGVNEKLQMTVYATFASEMWRLQCAAVESPKWAGAEARGMLFVVLPADANAQNDAQKLLLAVAPANKGTTFEGAAAIVAEAQSELASRGYVLLS